MLTEREKSLVRGLMAAIKELLGASDARIAELRTALDRAEQRIAAQAKQIAALERKAAR